MPYVFGKSIGLKIPNEESLMQIDYRIIFCLLVLLIASPGLAQNNVRINWTAVTGAQSGMFMALQEGLFK